MKNKKTANKEIVNKMKIIIYIFKGTFKTKTRFMTVNTAKRLPKAHL